MDFTSKLSAAWATNNSLLCIGLDPDMDKLPQAVRGEEAPQFAFNKAIIDATAGLVCAYKPNSAFYEARGADGIAELKQTCDYLRAEHPDIPIILDFKRGDIGHTNEQYARFAFDYLQVDAITVQPWAGREAVQPFLDHKDKGIIVLDRTSNPGAGEFQDLAADGQKLYRRVAANVTREWNANGNCLLVMGATYPVEMAEVRAAVGDDMTLLVPGLGAQAGDAAATVKAGLNARGTGLIINSSRDILYAGDGPDFAEAAGRRAQTVRDELNRYREE